MKKFKDHIKDKLESDTKLASMLEGHKGCFLWLVHRQSLLLFEDRATAEKFRATIEPITLTKCIIGRDIKDYIIAFCNRTYHDAYISTEIDKFFDRIERVVAAWRDPPIEKVDFQFLDNSFTVLSFVNAHSEVATN